MRFYRFIVFHFGTFAHSAIMKQIFQVIAASLLTLLSFRVQAQEEIDTLVDAGSYRLHFHIIKGKGVPILFEAGGGDNAATWNDLLPAVYNATGATLITYDRQGFGSSGLDTERYSIQGEIAGLETALIRLGYDVPVIMVAHSLGAFYTTLYTARHPLLVKGIVMLDGSLSSFFNKDAARKMLKMYDMEVLKQKNTGAYYTMLHFEETCNFMRTVTLPPAIAVEDMVAENPPYKSQAEKDRWVACHKKFAAASTARRFSIVPGTSHYIYKNRPDLVTGAISNFYRTAAGQ